MPSNQRADLDADVLIIGAGLSGIGAACQLTRRRPNTTYLILEARADLGGTWDLFRYPGVRNDSDMFTFGYGFRPWRGPRSIASGQAIHTYLRETAQEYVVTDRIRYHHRVVAAQWSSAQARWTLDVEVTSANDEAAGATDVIQLTCGFLWSNTGYYRYDHGHAPDISGLDTFAGTLIHPQHWPNGFDATGKRIVVIGSGATAVTLVPALARDAAEVIQIQRTPTYVAARPTIDALAARLAGRIPQRMTQRVMRMKYVLDAQVTYLLSQRLPGLVKAVLRRRARRLLPEGFDVASAFQPDYNPWDQRICVAADGDLFDSITSGRSRIVTSAIERVVPGGLQLIDGGMVQADVIITATGLDLLMLGGISLRVDGCSIDPADTTVFRGALLSGVPNFAFTLSVVTASWTLRSDLSAIFVCRVLAHIQRHGYGSVTPRLPAEAACWRMRPLLGYGSSYIQRSRSLLPTQGPRAPWNTSENHLTAVMAMKYRRVDHPDLCFT
ncbi:MAG: NAD(P)/FAD-dependent oxidoreductase [Ornithinimicrobium sp.]